MSQSTVCAVMLVNGRPEMVKRAIASFRAQTYERKRLLIWNTGEEWPVLRAQEYKDAIEKWGISEPRPDREAFHGATIGKLRNAANKYALAHYTTSDTRADIIAHWDSDDVSHPRRLEEQVALLEASGKMCVGYRELLFWDTRNFNAHIKGEWQTPAPGCENLGEAWLCRNHQANWAAGASLLYRRELWEQQPFDDAPHEDTRWMRTELVSRECLSVSSSEGRAAMKFSGATGQYAGIKPAEPCEPRMVCGIHASNTEGYDRAVMLRNPDVWRRAPEFDAYCERAMKL